MVRVLIANITSNQRVKVSIFKPDLHNIVYTFQSMIDYH